MITEEEYRKADDFWANNGETLQECLDRVHFPRFTCFEEEPGGISICEVRYRTKNGKVKTKWLEDKLLKKKYQLMSVCQWIFRPLFIMPRKKSTLPKDQSFYYLMHIAQNDDQGYPVSYRAKIATALSGTLLKKEIVKNGKDLIGEKEQLKLKFAFPKWLVAKMNRCLAVYFFPQLWIGPPCAVWRRIDNGVAFYLGSPESPGNQSSFELLNGPNGDAISVLLAYSCFAVLQSFFPSYHVLQKDASYFEAKTNIPNQIAVNIQCSSPAYVRKLVDICCGHFQKLESTKIPIVDGILVQKPHSTMKKLGVAEFERKVIQPACILWVNRDPVNELIQSGQIINLQASVQPETDLDTTLSTFLTFILAQEMQRQTVESFDECFKADWMQSRPYIREFLQYLRAVERRKIHGFSPDNIDIENELSKINRPTASPTDPIILLQHLSLCARFDVSDFDEDRPLTQTQKEQLKELCEDIKKECRKSSNEIRKVHKKNTRSFFSLDRNYQDTLQRLKENQSVGIMGLEIVKKIAYLSTSFRVFAYSAKQLEDECDMLCARVDEALIAAFRNQLCVQKPKAILAEYILSLLEAGQCARIRGKDSENSNIRVWYDPKEGGVFLISSKDYFDRMKIFTDISKKDFENALVDEGVLCTAQRENQRRRTFEIVVQKGGGKLSVLKIHAAKLSDHFSKSARTLLESIAEDKAPYRS